MGAARQTCNSPMPAPPPHGTTPDRSAHCTSDGPVDSGRGTRAVGGSGQGGLMRIADVFIVIASVMVVALLAFRAGVLWARSRGTGAIPGMGEQVLLGLGRLADQVRDLDHNRLSWQGQFSEQVAEVRAAAEDLRRETHSLSTALRRPHVRGRWGELHLRRAVELAGMVAHCDFTEQTPLADGRLRPDVVVHLAGGRSVVVDAKVPLDAFLDATETDQPDQRERHLVRHATAVRQHVDALSARSYWRTLPDAPEFVVMFIPGESVLAAAADTHRDLIEYAAARHVVIATPTTLIALLRTVAHGWAGQALGEQAQEIGRLGRELHQRLCTMNRHLDKVGRSLNTAVEAYNSAVGSWESRVLVTSRRFTELAGHEPPGPPRLVVDRIRETADRRVGLQEDPDRPTVTM